MSEATTQYPPHPYDDAHRVPDGDGASVDVDWRERLNRTDERGFTELDGWFSAEHETVDLDGATWPDQVTWRVILSPSRCEAIYVDDEWLTTEELHDEMAELPDPDGDPDGDQADDMSTDEREELRRAVLLCQADRVVGMVQDESPAMHGVEGPAMNYFYPLDTGRYQAEAHTTVVDWATRLEGLPLCAVELDGSLGLALTGGGMDLSWEIAEAHLRLGYAVPSHIKLPGYGDRGHSETDQAIIRAVVRAQQRAVAWATYRLQRVVEQFGVDLTDPRVEA